MADQPLKIWAKNINIDGITNTPQRRELENEEFLDGWLREMSVSTQQLNSLMYLLTLHTPPHPNLPFCYPQAVPFPDDVLEMNGQAITESAYPNAYDLYGSTLPNIVSDAPTGFTFIIRAS